MYTLFFSGHLLENVQNATSRQHSLLLQDIEVTVQLKGIVPNVEARSGHPKFCLP